MNQSEHKDLGQLTSLLLDGEISASDHERLSSLLENSADNRKAYLEYIRLESLLHWESNVADAQLPEKRGVGQLFVFRLPIWAGAMAAVFLAMSAIWWSYKPQELQNSFSVNPTVPPISPNAQSMNPGQPIDFGFDTNKGLVTLVNEPIQERSLSLEEQAIRAINFIEDKGSNMNDGILEYIGPLKRWNRTHALLIPAENGILPATGSSMIRLDEMSVSVETKTAGVEETVQVLDIREAIKGVTTENAKIFAAVKFNQSFGESQDGAEFGLTVQAFKKEENFSPKELSRADNKLSSDRDPSTWSALSSEMEIPNDADFLVVSLTARKTGPDSLLANSSTYYADDLELFLTFDNRSVIGPI